MYFILKKYIFAIVFLFVLASYSQVNNVNYKFIDDIAKHKFFKDFRFEIPNNWMHYEYDKGILLSSPKKFRDSITSYLSTPTFFVRKENYRKRSLDKYLDSEIKRLKSIYSEINYKLLKQHHSKLGSYYTILYASNSYDQKRITVIFLFFFKKKCYNALYIASSKYFDYYLLDIEKIINSFEIIE